MLPGVALLSRIYQGHLRRQARKAGVNLEIDYYRTLSVPQYYSSVHIASLPLKRKHGLPLKEIFAYENRANLKVPMIQGVGGSFDVLAGLVPRAPVWMQNWGLEWFFRVLQEPRRMFWRYLSTNTVFLISFFPHAIRFFFKSITRHSN